MTKKERSSDFKTYFGYNLVGVLAYILGFIFLVRGVFGEPSFFPWGILLIILGGFLRFKYKQRKNRK